MGGERLNGHPVYKVGARPSVAVLFNSNWPSVIQQYSAVGASFTRPQKYCTARMMHCHHSCCGLDNLNITGTLFLKTCHTIALMADSFLKSIARDVPSCAIIFCIFKVFFLKSKEVNLIKQKNLTETLTVIPT